MGANDPPNLNLQQIALANPTILPLTGGELLYGVQVKAAGHAVDVAITPASVAALGGGGGGAGTLGQQSLSLRTNFNTWIAANASNYLVANYQFGTGAVGGPGITTIANTTQLAQYFNPFQDFTEQTSINSEIQRYQPFNSTNHVFNLNNLTLQCVNPNGDWNCTAITQIAGTVNLNNTPTPIANLG